MKTLGKCCLCEECTEFFIAFSDKTRQDIIMIFTQHKELCVNDIANQFSLSRPTISHHLSVLKRANILSTRKDGKEIYFSINKPFVAGILKSVLKDIETCC